jgi:hypothetical protein
MDINESYYETFEQYAKGYGDTIIAEDEAWCIIVDSSKKPVFLHRCKDDVGKNVMFARVNLNGIVKPCLYCKEFPPKHFVTLFFLML